MDQKEVNYDNNIQVTSKELDRIDTCQWSILHKFFAAPPGKNLPFWKSKFLPYLITVFLFVLFPFVVALIKLPTIFTPIPGLNLPFLRDWNILFMYLVTLPLLITVILGERNLIPSYISRVNQEGIIKIEKNISYRFCQQWTNRYKIVNLALQLIGLLIGITVALANYRVIVPEDFLGWQSTNGSINLPGWIYLIWQIPFFYFVVTIYIGRGILTLVFLKTLVKVSLIRVIPYHPDQAGGLSPIGRIGLRNQCILTVGGINVVLLFFTAKSLKPDPNLTMLLIAAAILYIIGSPFVFLSPLLPFRKSMLEKKKEQLKIVNTKLQEEYAKAIKNLQQNKLDHNNGEVLKLLQYLRSMVDRIPVWPFDVETLKKVFASYIFPILVMVARTVGKILGF